MIACGPGLVYKFRADVADNRTTIDRYYAQRPFVFRLQVPFLVGLLTILPFVAHAERRLTYRCNGIESSDGGDIHTKVRIKRFYTLYIEDSGGRWFNWDEHMWYPIHSVNEDAFHFHCSHCEREAKGGRRASRSPGIVPRACARSSPTFQSRMSA